MENLNPKKMLDVYIHDLFVKDNMPDLAEALRKVSNLHPRDSVTVDAPKGFLLDWFSILQDECNSAMLKLDSNRASEDDASKTKDFLLKWVPILRTGGNCLFQWFPLFHDRYCAEIAKRVHTTQDSSSKVSSVDREIARQVLWNMTFELYWLGAEINPTSGKTANNDWDFKRLKKLSEWFTTEYHPELAKHTDDDATNLIQGLLPIFIRSYSFEIANRPKATQESPSSKLDFDGEIAKQVVCKMASDPSVLEAAKEVVNQKENARGIDQDFTKKAV